MATELSSKCECPNCLEGSQSESDWNFSSKTRGNGASYSRSSKKPTLSPIMQRFLSQCCSNELESSNKEDFTFLPSEEESSVDFSQTQNFSQTSTKAKPLREMTIQELLSKFGDNGKLPLHSVSLGNFRDHVVVKFRRALYYSGIWVKYVRGSVLKKQFSANYFKRNPNSLHRLIPWLKRELIAVCGDYGYTVKNILAAILHHMTKFNLDSESFTHLLEPYLLQHTQHFLHEFISFVRSSYNMETYDQTAIYQCPVSTWMKKKTTVSAPVLCLPEDLSFMISQQGIKQVKKSRNRSGRSSHSGLKQFPRGHHSSKNPQISTTRQKTANKHHVWTKDECESDDFKDMVCATNSLLDWAHLRESRPDTECCKNNNQKKKSKGTKLLPGHIQDLKMHETGSHTFRALVDSNQAPPRKYNIRETNVLNPDQQVHYQKKEAEKKKLEESSLKTFQRSPTERALIDSKSRETDHSCNCISENSPSPTRNDKMLTSVRKKMIRCSQSSQCVGSHNSRRTQRQYSPRIPRSKSWCVRSRKHSMSRGQSNLSLRECHRSKHCGLSKGSAQGCESAYRMASLNPVHCAQVCLTDRKSCNCESTGEGDSQTGGQCESLSCLQTEKCQSPSKQDMKEKHRVGRVRRIRKLGHRKPKYKCVGTQTTAEFSDDLGESQQ